MTVIFERGDKLELKEAVSNLQKCGLAIDIVDQSQEHLQRKVSDARLAKALALTQISFRVSTQWAAIYRVLVDFYGFPEDMNTFCERIREVAPCLTFPCTYQSIQKPLAASAILQKHYDRWREYKVPAGDLVFHRQKQTADMLLGLLENGEYTLRGQQYTL